MDDEKLGRICYESWVDYCQLRDRGDLIGGFFPPWKEQNEFTRAGYIASAKAVVQAAELMIREELDEQAWQDEVERRIKRLESIAKQVVKKLDLKPMTEREKVTDGA